jgi:hypothetical protein
MAAVLTTAMTLRIILSVRGTLVQGGSFALSNSTANSGSRTANIVSSRSANLTNLSSQAPHTYTLDDMRTKPENEWVDEQNVDSKPAVYSDPRDNGVKVTVDRQIGYDQTRK